jgi:Flp pilus assembly protein TadD
VADLTALVQLARRQTADARASYARALQFSPNDLEALAGTVQIDLASGRAEEGLALIERRLTEAKPPVEVLLLAARTYGLTGHASKMETVLRQAIEADPARLDAYGQLGQLYVRQHRLAEATERFRDVLKYNPKSVSASTMVAMLLEQQGQQGEAEKEYRRLLGQEPRAAVAANNLAWIEVANSRSLDEALQLAQTAHQQLPDEPHVSDTLGWVYYRKDMASTAVPYLEASVQKLPNDPSSEYHLGMAYVQTGEWDKARRALKHAFALKPDFDGAVEAKKALTTIGF